MAEAFAGLTRVSKTLSAISASAGKAAENIQKASSAMKGLGATVSELIQTSRDAPGGAKDASSGGQKDWQDKQIAMLEKLKADVIPFEGADAGKQFSMDVQINDVIQKIKAGTMTGAEGIAFLMKSLQSALPTWYQQQLFGSSKQSDRDFLYELERFINSGNVNI